MIATRHRSQSILVGHSLGGTLAAIAASIEPPLVSKLVLVEAPLNIGEHTGALGPLCLRQHCRPILFREACST
ncbi:alpha/beta fold hydrolase [Bradyrhizobium sp. CCBAU 11357]|uniref:alpha/beta fold hydrolase n=1 Tax=Bradyrhizobium sp. CCBAU 11357 TaxID=1630808 RepID=UPI003FA43A55